MFGAAIAFPSTPVVRPDSAQFPEAVLGTPPQPAGRGRLRPHTKSAISVRFAHITLRDEAACRIAVGNHRAQRTVCVQILTHRDRVTRADGSPSHRQPPRRGSSRASLRLAGRFGGLASDGAVTFMLINHRSRAVSTGLVTCVWWRASCRTDTKSPAGDGPQLTAVLAAR